RLACEVHGDAGGSHDCGLPRVETRCGELLPPRAACLKVDRYESQPLRDAEPKVDEALTLPRLRAGAIHLEHLEAGSDLRSPLGETVEACAKEHVLANAPAGLLHHQVFDKPGPRHDGAAEDPRELRVHVRAASPAVIRCDELQSDRVVEHVRWRIELDVQGAP